MPGVTPAQLLNTAGRAQAASAEMAAEGPRLTYLSATLLSGGRDLLLPVPRDLRAGGQTGQQPAGIYERITPAVHLAMEDLPSE